MVEAEWMDGWVAHRHAGLAAAAAGGGGGVREREVCQDPVAKRCG